METDIVEGSARIVEFFVGEDELAESEIADFDVEKRILAENILWLCVRANQPTRSTLISR